MRDRRRLAASTGPLDWDLRGCVAAAALATGLLQYLMPASFDNAPSINHAGVIDFSSAIFGRTWPSLHTVLFVWSFRILLAAMWLAYALMVRGLLDDDNSRRWALPLVAVIALLVAFLFPPSLSADL